MTVGRWGTIIGHAVGIAVSVSLLTAIPVTMYAVGAFVSDDPGGPYLLAIVPLLSFALAIGISLLVCLPVSLCFRWLARSRGMPWWVPPPAFFCLSCLVCGGGALCCMDRAPPVGYVGVAVTLGGFLTAGFTAYWCALIVVRYLLHRA